MRRLNLDGRPQQARSQDDTKRPVTSVPLLASPSVPSAQPHPQQITVTLLSAILQGKETYRRFLCLRDELAQMSLDTLQWVSPLRLEILAHWHGLSSTSATQIIDSGKLSKQQKTMFVTALLRLSIKSTLYPTCLILKDVEREPFACANGGFGDIYKGRFRDRMVCIKVVKVYMNSRVDHAIKVCGLNTSLTVHVHKLLWCRHFQGKQFYGVKPDIQTFSPFMASTNWTRCTVGFVWCLLGWKMEIYANILRLIQRRIDSVWSVLAFLLLFPQKLYLHLFRQETWPED